MLFEYPQDKRETIISLFKEHEYLEALILGTVVSDLGKILVDDLEQPKNAMLLFGKSPTTAILGGVGEGETTKELVSKIPNKSGILCPNDNWRSRVKEFLGKKVKSKPRTKLSSANLDIEYIRKLKVKIPEGYEIVEINEEIIEKFEENTIEKICHFCGSIEQFRKTGFGFCALKDDKIVADATNGGLLYDNAFELDIETHPDHRRKGLATAVSAHLIAYSLENDYDPRWDAANTTSTDLALKIGYTDPEDYEIMIYWLD